MVSKVKNVELPKELKESAQKIWLAGLGALAVAEQEGSKLFKNLVKKGEEYEAKGKGRAEKLRADLDEQVGKAKNKATETWSKLEETVDEKVTAALHRMGVPSKDEIQKLSRRVEELNASIERLKPKTTRATAAAAATEKPAKHA